MALVLLSHPIPTLAMPLQPVTLRGVGMGEAMRSVGMSNDGMFVNPATVAVGKRFQADVAYGYHAPGSKNIASLSVVDSKSGPVALGIAHTRLLGPSSSSPISQRNAMAIGGILQEMLAIGLGLEHAVGQSLGEQGWNSLRHINLDVGLVLRLGQLLNLGVVAQRMLPTSYPDTFPATFSGGISLYLGHLTLAYDASYLRQSALQTKPDWAHYTGGELLLWDNFALRGGLSHQQPAWNGTHKPHLLVSAGLAALSGTGSLQLAYQHTLGTTRPAYRILASLAFFL